MTELRQEVIAGSVFAYWADQFPLEVSTVYPGTALETSALDEWLEIWIDAWSLRPQRHADAVLLDLSLTVHCFVKPGLDKGRAHELADAARGTLSRTTIELRDHEQSGLPLVGYALVFEPETRALTRNHAGELQSGLQHLVVSWRGIAQGVAS